MKKSRSNIDPVSIENYYLFIEQELTKRQMEVYNCFNGSPLTSEQVANQLNKGLNVISGRLTELVEQKYLKKYSGAKNSKGNPCNYFLKLK